MKFLMPLKKAVKQIEECRYINLKTILLLYLITRFFLVFLLAYAEWNGEDMLCYPVDCKQHWHNVEYVVDGLNPYKMWKHAGGYGLPIPLRADHPPLLYILLPAFAWFWKSIWAMMSVFFIFDLLNLLLIYRLAEFKKTSTLLYVFAPSIIRGLVFTEEEIFVTFVLASIYFLNKKRYALSTIMLALSFNIKFFPILLFPVLLLSMEAINKSKKFPRINSMRLMKQTTIFILVSLFCHLFFYPDWYMFYENRTFYWTLGQSNWAFWRFLPTTYYPLVLASTFILFYLYTYTKKLDIKTGYLLGSLLFISFYPKFSPDHLIFLIPLFLIWTRLNSLDIILWISLCIAASLAALSLPTIGLFNRPLANDILFMTMIFFITIINGLRREAT